MAKGELLSVMGPVGAGKTTLLMVILEELQPRKGQVRTRQFHCVLSSILLAFECVVLCCAHRCVRTSPIPLSVRVPVPGSSIPVQISPSVLQHVHSVCCPLLQSRPSSLRLVLTQTCSVVAAPPDPRSHPTRAPGLHDSLSGK